MPWYGCSCLGYAGELSDVSWGVFTRFERSSGGGLMSALTTTVFLPLFKGHLRDATA